jgi:diketogulonate reductase-like aldo/keto reductase
VQVRGVHVPDFVYGTAWKESRTQGLVELAIREGFRAIDTANQRKHYVEEAVGRGIAVSGIALDQLFIQTKFTHRAGQDERLPYDERAPIATQVAQSFESSLAHLGKVDSFVLHGPSLRDGLAAEDLEAWRAIEALGVALVGISNVNAGQVEDLVAFAKVPPAFVQNRCYASTGWDRDVRAVCARHGIVYQGFSLLTANRDVVQHHREVRALAAERGLTTAQLVFAFAHRRGMLPLTGTSSADHMRLDLASLAIELGPEDLTFLDTCGM